MQTWKCCLTVHQPFLHQLYWNQSFCWNWDNEISFIPNWFSGSPARLLLGPGGCPAEERWTESFWGSRFPWWLCLPKGDGTKRRKRRRTEWSKQRQSKRRVRSSGSETEKKNKCAPHSKWDYFLLFLSYLCFNTFFLDADALQLILTLFFSPVSTCLCLYYLSTLLSLSDSHPQRQGHSRRGTPLLCSYSLCLTPSHTSPSLLSHFFLSVLDDGDYSAAAPAQMREDKILPSLFLSLSSLSLRCCVSVSLLLLFLFSCKLYSVTLVFIFERLYNLKFLLSLQKMQHIWC